MKIAVLILSFALALTSCTPKYEIPLGQPSQNLAEGIAAFVSESQSVPIKSVIVLQHGKKVAEAYMNGWNPEEAHEMWSISKTFTAFAVGFAIEEGLLSFDDKLTDLFPEESFAVLDTLSNKEYAANLRACTIRDLMIMGCGHAEDPTGPVLMDMIHDHSNNTELMHDLYDIDGNIVQEFLKYPFTYTPATFNCYNSLGSYMLSAAVTKVSGELINDYLYPRLWKKLGMDKPQWEILCGYNCGGWGLYLTTEAMARAGQMMLDGGRYAGRQVLPKGFIEEASQPFFNWGIPSWSSPWEGRHYAVGYGYQMWINTDAFYASGHMGQYIYVFPEYDAVVAVTADFQDGDGYSDSGLYVWKHLVLPLQYDCYENVEIQGSKGTLRGYIDRPSEDSNQPVVIICHGLTGSKDEMHISKLADELRIRGIASIRFDFNGHGQSDGLFREHTVVNEVEDLNFIYDYVRSLPWVDTSRIGLAGHSQGGFVAGVAAGDIGADKIKAVSLLAPAALIHTTTKEGVCFGDESMKLGNIEELPDSIFVWGRYFGKEYLKAALETDVYARTSAYEGPVYILQGSADSKRLFDDALKYKDILKNSEIEILDNYPHCFDPNVRFAMSKVAQWFKERLLGE